VSASSAEPRRFDLSRRVTFVAIGQALAKVSQLIVGIILVRSLSDFDWSRIALVLLVYQTAVGLGGLNMHQSLYFFLGRLPREEKRSFVLQNAALLTCSGLITAVVVLLLSDPVGGGHFQVDHLLPWVALAIFLEIPTSGIPELLIAFERTGRAATVQAMLSLLQVTAVCVPIVAGAGLEGGVAGLLAYTVLRLIFFVVLVVAVTPPGPARVLRGRLGDIPWGRIKEQLIYVAPLAMALTVHLLNRNVDKWYIAWLLPEDFGVYTIAGTEVPVVSVVSSALGAVLATRLVRAFRDDKPDYAHAIWMAGASRMTLLVLPITTGVIALAPELLVTLFGSSYAAATLPFQIWTCILYHRVAEYGVVLRASGDTRTLWCATAILFASNAVLSLLGVLLGGMVGAAVGTMLANGIFWWFVLVRIGRAMKRPTREVFPWRLWLTVLGLSALCGAVAWIVAALLPLEGLVVPALVVKTLVYIGLYILLTRLLRFEQRLPAVPDDTGSML
jgi:O-antigen/teichoic acid export membrane protein